jgi:hypothetical protein
MRKPEPEKKQTATTAATNEPAPTPPVPDRTRDRLLALLEQAMEIAATPAEASQLMTEMRAFLEVGR